MLSKSNFLPGSTDLQKKIVRKLKLAKIQHQMIKPLEKTYIAVLLEEHIVLSRPERRRLLAKVTKSLLEEMLAKVEASLEG